MSVLIYNISIRLYRLLIAAASLFNAKARLWVQGRKNIFARLQEQLGDDSHPVWMHCASLGEFEQGRPVIEALKQQYPEQKILLTFFSPSGYEVRRNYAGADYVFYLPLDTKANAVKFLAIAKPRLAIFVKYEYWYHYLHALKANQVPVIIISAIFQPGSIFFKWYGSLHRRMLQCFVHIFVQDNESRELLAAVYPAAQITVAGDTRFDRVAVIARDFSPIDAIERFTAGKQNILVAGSTWPGDEAHIKSLSGKITLIIAPHEIHEDHLQAIQSLFPDSIRYSVLNILAGKGEDTPDKQVLIIDNIGMLSKLYYYADICYVGGGFNSGIHNTLEAAVHGKPVIFGPKYEKFAEAKALIKNGGGFSYTNDKELIEIVGMLINNKVASAQSATVAGNYVQENTGATGIIMGWLGAAAQQEKTL